MGIKKFLVETGHPKKLFGIKVKKIEVKEPPILFKETQKVIREAEQKMDGDFLVYWVSDNSMMSSNDVIAFNKVLKERVKNKKLYLFIKSDGGASSSGLRIINLLRQYYEKIIALVPLDCASAATMLVLGADNIKMGPMAYLSPVDTSINHDLSPVDQYNSTVSVSQNELDRVIKLWERKGQSKDKNLYGTLYRHIHPLVFGAVDRASSLSIKLTSEILSYHMTDGDKIMEISDRLNSEYPSHGYPITLKEATRIGLNVEELGDNLNGQLLQLNELYSEMAQLAYTDYDERTYHDNEILKLIEMNGQQIYYQKDKDMRYRIEEQRWIPMHDESSWRVNSIVDDEIIRTKFYIN